MIVAAPAVGDPTSQRGSLCATAVEARWEVGS